MYKFLLCWRYLRTRYIALASIVSVMLGVATMIVVNAVMDGFAHEMQGRMNDILSDVTFQCRSLEGVPDADRYINVMRDKFGDDIEGITATAQVPAMLGFYLNGEYVTRQLMVVGIDKDTYANVSAFGEYLQHPENREQLSFDLRENGYDIIDHQAADPSLVSPRLAMGNAGWTHRRERAIREGTARPPAPSTPPPAADSGSPFASAAAPVGSDFDPSTEQFAGCVLGISTCSYKHPNGTETFALVPGDDVEITYPSAGRPPKPLSSKFTVVDLYESKLLEFDGNYMFVPLERLQEIRGMVDPTTKARYFNTIQIRLRDGVDADVFCEQLRELFPLHLFAITTWRDQQGPLLAAVQTETVLLNILLFMIVLVSGFGILAIFFMIVVEKTRDIGILKSLGASRMGVMSIFLSYGFGLGVVGALIGVCGGVAFTLYINEIKDFITWLFEYQVFPADIYFFSEIPARLNPWTIALVAGGAIVVAVLASVLPARRAASLHPVEALRFE